MKIGDRITIEASVRPDLYSDGASGIVREICPNNVIRVQFDQGQFYLDTWSNNTFTLNRKECAGYNQFTAAQLNRAITAALLVAEKAHSALPEKLFVEAIEAGKAATVETRR